MIGSTDIGDTCVFVVVVAALAAVALLGDEWAAVGLSPAVGDVLVGSALAIGCDELP